MTYRIKACLVLAALLLSLSVQAGDDRAELARLLESFLAGASKNDADVHERFWADDLIYTSSDGRRFGKPLIIDSLRQDSAEDDASEGDGDAADAVPPEYSARDTTIRVFGDTAVITFRLMAHRDGQPVGEYFNTGVFRQREPGWQAVTWQATRAAMGEEQPPDSGD